MKRSKKNSCAKKEHQSRAKPTWGSRVAGHSTTDALFLLPHTHTHAHMPLSRIYFYTFHFFFIVLFFCYDQMRGNNVCRVKPTARIFPKKKRLHAFLQFIYLFIFLYIRYIHARTHTLNIRAYIIILSLTLPVILQDRKKYRHLKQSVQ